LGVHVDQQNGQTIDSDRRGEVNSRRRFSDAALLIRDGQDEWFGDVGPRGQMVDSVRVVPMKIAS
jgi:hypothetical protein